MAPNVISLAAHGVVVGEVAAVENKLTAWSYKNRAALGNGVRVGSRADETWRLPFTYSVSTARAVSLVVLELAHRDRDHSTFPDVHGPSLPRGLVGGGAGSREEE